MSLLINIFGSIIMLYGFIKVDKIHQKLDNQLKPLRDYFDKRQEDHE